MGTKTISVMGCGWLGLPLAEELVRLGYRVKGSTTTPGKLPLLQEKGIEPFLISFPENRSESKLQEFLDAEVLLFNLPPSRSSTDTNSYEEVLQKVLEAAPARLKNAVFVSSTSVYPDLNRDVTEEDAIPAAEASSLLLRCEFLVQQTFPDASTIVRFGGLMGGNRKPGRFLAGKTDVPQPEAPVNMIHLTDAVQVITQILEQEKWGFVFNACAPNHPSRKEFYTKAAQLLELTPPQFQEQGELTFKRINSDFLRQELGFTFRFPDPLVCLSAPEF
ncbi:SDR family oxidoreductase [Sabulibacter ruber]|uniref:SDR family oxidoreductase n=1 Tax=Sabulibacter ruber TaxID=2811901 RepID=UPI001A95BF93|nr:SDR family oxidoreductase [Sabulibacter ruber]